jgi:osmotically-inducible protein OsmY
MSTMATDRDIRAAVYAELVTDQLIDADDIEVEVTNGVVSLTGTVPAHAQISEATAAARRADGVNRVDTLLAVAMPGDGFGDNEALAQSANRELAANGTVPDGVRASAREGHVYLTGTVSISAQRVAAEDTVAAVAGVVSITNLIKVRGEA